MMRYQKISHNFIPKDNATTTVPETMPLTENNKLLQEENHEKNKILKEEGDLNNKLLEEENERLISQITEYKRKIISIEEGLKDLKAEKEASDERVVSLEDNLKKYEDIKDSIHMVDKFKNEVDILTSEVHILTEKNKELTSQLESYQEHVQTLYLILLIVALL